LLAHRLPSGMEILKRWRDLLHEQTTGIRQRFAWCD
jgi:hypothetical protein